MEQPLSAWLDLAQIWNAIVLINEGDVYLAKREHNKLQRSTLVTAFFRSLEYFSVMIFRMTNQPAYIDHAFISRLHLIIEYPHLDEDKQSKNLTKFTA